MYTSSEGVVAAIPEFELAAHLPVFNLYELIIAG